MLETSSRLLRLLSLFQAQKYWSGAALCARLEVTPRTVRRDVDRLRTLGYPVHSCSGTAGGYQLGAGASMPPLLLDDEEAVAVAVGLRTAASGAVEGVEEASVRALSKLEALLPASLRRRVGALNSYIVPMGYEGPSVSAETLAVIASACRDAEHLRFAYQSRDGAASEREVEPHRLVNNGRRWYLAAWDPSRDNWRTFRVDRIEGRLRTGARFAPRKAPEGGFAAYVARSVSFQQDSETAVVRVRAAAAEVEPRIHPSYATCEAEDGGTCLVRLRACSVAWAPVHLAMLGFDFEVLEPAALTERLRLLAERFDRAAPPQDRGAVTPAQPSRST